MLCKNVENWKGKVTTTRSWWQAVGEWRTHAHKHRQTDNLKTYSRIPTINTMGRDIINWLYYIKAKHTDTDTHTHLTALFPGLPGWAGTRKAKPIWILLKQETVSGSGISWAICKSAPSSRQITTPAPDHSLFYRPDALPAAQPTASKHWRPSNIKAKKCNYKPTRSHPTNRHPRYAARQSQMLWQQPPCCDITHSMDCVVHFNHLYILGLDNIFNILSVPKYKIDHSMNNVRTDVNFVSWATYYHDSQYTIAVMPTFNQKEKGFCWSKV